MEQKIQEAIKLFQEQKWDEAIDAFSQILETTQSAEIYNNLALCYYNKSDLEKAEMFYLKALETNPKLTQVYINLADLYFRQKNFVSAINLLQSGVYELPDEIVLSHYLARVYMEDARLDLAIDELNKVLEAQEENYDAYYDLGRIYFELGEYDLTVSNFESVLEYKDNNEWVYFYLGQAYEANDQVDKAMSSYLRAIALNEKFYPAYKKVAILFLARNDFQDAIEYFEDYMSFDLPQEEKENIQATVERIKGVNGLNS